MQCKLHTLHHQVSDANRTRIVGEVTSARFGHALTALGDLDGDGYDGGWQCGWSWCCLPCTTIPGVAVCLPSAELAVSAPYGEGRSGTVFIYSGENGSPIPVLSQTIVGSEVNLERTLLNGLTSFGAFIEGNTDIDGNCHNGAPLVLPFLMCYGREAEVSTCLHIFCRFSYWSFPKSQDFRAQVCVWLCMGTYVCGGRWSGVCVCGR